MEEKEQAEKILLEAGVNDKAARVLQMLDGAAVLGNVLLRLQEDAVAILKFTVPGYGFDVQPDAEQGFVLDSLMRAAASYGENNGAAKIIMEFPDFYGFFKARGFSETKGWLHTPMETIVSYHA